MDQLPAPNAISIKQQERTARGKFQPAPVGVTKPIPYVNADTEIAPSIIIASPAAAHLVKNPARTASAPKGSAIDKNLVRLVIPWDIPFGGADQNGNL